MNKNKLPLISILIANYNNKPLIERCIKSCLNQNYKNTEILFHDDYSSDGSISEVKKFSYVKKFFNKKKKKIPYLDAMSAYIKMFNKSKGKYIFLLDSDDFFFKNKIKIFLEIFSKSNDIEFIQDFPAIINKNNKNFFLSRWPLFAPTSCLAFTRNFFNNFLDFHFQNKPEKYPEVWLDFRICSFAYFKSNNLLSLNSNYTFYEQSLESNQSKKFFYLSKDWIRRRFYSHLYVNSFNTSVINFSFDYYFTKILYKIIGSRK
jgi:glycosyltransferase involved in cell wall biosynthesis